MEALRKVMGAKELSPVMDIPYGATERVLLSDEAADIYSSTSLDFVDCLLAGYSKIKNYSIFTFDKPLQRKIQSL